MSTSKTLLTGSAAALAALMVVLCSVRGLDAHSDHGPADDGATRIRTVGPLSFQMNAQDGATSLPHYPLLEVSSATGGRTIVDLNLEVLEAVTLQPGAAFTTTIPLDADRTVVATLRPFYVTSENTRFVIGRHDGPDQVVDFDARERIRLLRGTVSDHPHSNVFLAVSAYTTMGIIDLHPGAPRYLISSEAPGLTAGQVVVFPASAAATSALPEHIDRCGLDALLGSAHSSGADHPQDHDSRHEHGRRSIAAGPVEPVAGMKHLELALETDFQYYALFNDAEAAMSYATILFAAVSDVYMRDVNTQVELSFVRLFDNELDEPMFMDTPDPISPFRSYWNDNMSMVHRDVAQFLSGRRDLPYGGVAYLNALCNSAAYSVVGYALGFFPGPDVPANGHYDLNVCAHELGHNCGTLHTHDYGLDNCNVLGSDPQRGPIMSYCSQTVSGGEANIDSRFHAEVQAIMEEFIGTSACIVDDCNLNATDDLEDISGGTSQDTNGNDIPDECEDCNGNGTLDDQDIAGGLPDINANGIPDGCEADCNDNNLPDDWEVAEGLADDLYGHNFPDSCDSDCNGDLQSDYNQLQADMSLDVTRNLVLDQCEDCDGDQIPDLEALDGAHNPWVASLTMDVIAEFHANTGVRMNFSQAGQISSGLDLIINDDGDIFVASGDDDRVVSFARDGSYLGDFVSAGSGGLDMPTALAFGPGGNLFVASGGTSAVLEYDGQDGSFVGTFVASGDGGLGVPFGLTFGPNGNLFVSDSSNDQVLEFDGGNGSFVGVFVSSGNGGLANPHGLVFEPQQGNLLVISHASDQLLEYTGASGAFVGQFNNGGTDTNLTLAGPWSVRIGPNGNVFVSRLYEEGEPGGGGGIGGPGPQNDGPHRHANLHITSTRVYEFDIDNGNFIRSYITGNDTEFFRATGFDFMPGAEQDCNVNYAPDNCDIASGLSVDADGDGVPDECAAPCAADIDGDGVVNATDVAQVLGQWASPGPEADIAPPGGDGIVDAFDLASVLGAWGPCP